MLHVQRERRCCQFDCQRGGLPEGNTPTPANVGLQCYQYRWVPPPPPHLWPLHSRGSLRPSRKRLGCNESNCFVPATRQESFSSFEHSVSRFTGTVIAKRIRLASFSWFDYFFLSLLTQRWCYLLLFLSYSFVYLSFCVRIVEACWGKTRVVDFSSYEKQVLYHKRWKNSFSPAHIHAMRFLIRFIQMWNLFVNLFLLWNSEEMQRRVIENFSSSNHKLKVKQTILKSNSIKKSNNSNLVRLLEKLIDCRWHHVRYSVDKQS